MKISYKHPKTGNRTSITLSNRIFRLWANCNHYDITTDDFMYDPDCVKLLKIWLADHHKDYLKNSSNYPTFVSYFENIVLLEVEMRLTRPYMPTELISPDEVNQLILSKSKLLLAKSDEAISKSNQSLANELNAQFEILHSLITEIEKL